MTKRSGWRSFGRKLGQALGFTLIEMAIVLVVIGLIVSGGLVAVGPVVENAKINETVQKLDRVEQALVVHVIQHGCLPCPAGPGEPATAAYDAGYAVAGGAEYTTSCTAAACDFAQGALPWVKLGISEADASDAFGARFSYSVPGALTLADSMVRTGSSYPTGPLQVTNYGGTVITENAAYVLVSHGPNRGGGYLMSTGTLVPSLAYASPTEPGNADGAEPYVQDDPRLDKSGTAYFDDIVRWRSAPMIIQQCGSGSCGNPL